MNITPRLRQTLLAADALNLGANRDARSPKGSETGKTGKKTASRISLLPVVPGRGYDFEIPHENKAPPAGLRWHATQAARPLFPHFRFTRRLGLYRDRENPSYFRGQIGAGRGGIRGFRGLPERATYVERQPLMASRSRSSSCPVDRHAGPPEGPCLLGEPGPPLAGSSRPLAIRPTTGID